MKLYSSNNQEINLEKINIICNTAGKNAEKIADMLSKLLEQYNHNFNRQDFNPNNSDNIKYDENATFAISIGGDGTLLSTARFYSQYNTPVLGINLGRLGFLAQIDHNKLKQGLIEITNGNFIVQKRMMIESTIHRTDKKLIALNDIVIKGGAISRTSRLFLSINGQEVCDYLADGIIITTPTGSTAYNLSANGPIISPMIDAITITPICPHTLSIRPLVIDASEHIEIKTDKTTDLIYITADGQNSCKIEQESTITVQKSPNISQLVLLKSNTNNFYSVLREKLNWGIPLLKN